MKKIKIKKPNNRKLLKEWSRIVRDRDGNCCAVCGSDKFIQAHHLLAKKKYPQYKLDPKIGIALCSGHHCFFPRSAETNAIWFANWLRINRPEQYEYCFNLIFTKENKDDLWKEQANTQPS